MRPSYVIVIGASAGGMVALLELVQGIPASIDAAIGVVLHVGSRHSVLPELLSARGPCRAAHAQEGEPLRAGRIYVAPPDYHMLFTCDVVRLSRGPRENHARPAIDPLFRSAALNWRERTIGVVLSGDLDDGTAGLAGIKAAGGTAVVQDPDTAIQRSMPASAKANVAVDHCLPLPEIATVLLQLAGRVPPARSATLPEQLVKENAIFEGNIPLAKVMENLAAVGTLSALTCPECGGGLWEIKQARPLRYRCHTGHGFSAASLEAAQIDQAEQALWSGVRALQEREMLLRRLAGVAEATGDKAQAQAGRREADRVHEQAEQLSRLVEKDLSDGVAAVMQSGR